MAPDNVAAVIPTLTQAMAYHRSVLHPLIEEFDLQNGQALHTRYKPYPGHNLKPGSKVHFRNCLADMYLHHAMNFRDMKVMTAGFVGGHVKNKKSAISGKDSGTGRL